MNGPWSGYETVQKEWGWSQRVVQAGGADMHRIGVLAGGFCSVHKHQTKNNLFLCTRGHLVVETGVIASGVFELRLEQLLGTGDQTYVPAGVWHRFRAPEGAEAIEFYWVETGDEDIVRHCPGGVRV